MFLTDTILSRFYEEHHGPPQYANQVISEVMSKDGRYPDDRGRRQAEPIGTVKPQSLLDMSVVINNNAAAANQRAAAVGSQHTLYGRKSGGIVSTGGIRDNVTTELDLNSNHEKTSDQKQSNASLPHVAGAATQSMHRI